MKAFENILKTLLFSKDINFWLKYRNYFKQIFVDVSIEYDKVLSLMEEHHLRFDVLPNEKTILSLLNTKGFEDGAKYVSNILNNTNIRLYDEIEQFVSFLEVSKTECLTEKSYKFISNVNEKYSTLKKTEKNLSSFVDDCLSDLVTLKDSLNSENKASEYLLFGNESVEFFKNEYKKILENKQKGNKNYYDVPFEIFKSVNIKPGDLYITGGYTSQGKSVYLRYLTYYYLITHGLNAIFFTLEMDAEVVWKLFHIMHANNKAIFPNTPRISYSSYKKGELTDEEDDFLHNVVVPDLGNSDKYGILKIYKPNKVRFTLDDLKIVVRETQLMMPVDVLSVDYLTLLNPLPENSKRSPQMEDFNQMIKEFKQLLLTNIDGKSNKTPLIGLTAAQISRQGYQECLKNQKNYNMSAFSSYNEIERSADVLMSILRDPELAKTNRVKLQFLKNRDGEVPFEGKDFICNVDQGGLILDAKEQSIENLNEMIQEFNELGV